MSSKTLTVESEPSAPELAPELRESYRRLLRVLRAMRGTFALVPVESDLPAEERERVFECLERDLAADEVELRFADVFYEEWDPVHAVEAALSGGNGSAVVLLRGLERTPPALPSLERNRRPKAFARLNQAREAIEQRFQVPLVVWCDPHTYGALQRYAPDFFDHFTGLVRFRALARAGVSKPRTHGVAAHLTISPSGHAVAYAPLLGDKEARFEARVEKEPGSEAAIRFYEAQLEKSEAGSPERLRALLGLAEALVKLRGSAKYTAAAQALEAVGEALELVSAESDPREWGRAKTLQVAAYEHCGSFEAARDALHEALVTVRQRAAASPVSNEPEVTAVLYNLGRVLHSLGQWQEAFEATRKSVKIFRRLAASRPDAFLLGLASSLNDLRLSARSRPESQRPRRGAQRSTPAGRGFRSRLRGGSAAGTVLPQAPAGLW